MHTYVALLRGINVSGHNIIKMVMLKEVLEKNGLHKVITYLQSGNIIFHSDLSDVKRLEEKIHHIIAKEFGLEITVLVIKQADFKKRFKNSPFPAGDTMDLKKIMFIYTQEGVDDNLWTNLDFNSNYEERFILGNKVIYIYYTNNYGKSKVSIALLERKLKISCTARNWNTSNKLYKLLQ